MAISIVRAPDSDRVADRVAVKREGAKAAMRAQTAISVLHPDSDAAQLIADALGIAREDWLDLVRGEQRPLQDDDAAGLSANERRGIVGAAKIRRGLVMLKARLVAAFPAADFAWPVDDDGGIVERVRQG